MKNVKYLLTVLLIAIIGCTQESIINEAEIAHKVYISVSIMQSRTILPHLDITKLKYCLTGKMDGVAEEEFLGEFTYDKLVEAKIPVWAGVWDFTLTAKKGIRNVLIGTLSDQSVNKNETYNLVFSMRECDVGFGNIKVDLQMPAGATVAKIEATLTDLSGDVINTQSLNVQAGDDYQTSRYCETAIKGYYWLTVELYQDLSDDVPINVKTVIVQVETGCESSGTVSFDTVNNYWSIKYNCKGLDFIADYVPPNKYNSHTQITLPTIDKIANSNIYIIGWSSTNSDILFGEPTTDIIDYDSTGDKEYYLKYIDPKDIRVSVAELERALSLTDDTADALKITIVDSTPDLSAVRNIITSYRSKEIYLNLSECSGLASIDSQLKNWTQLVGIDIPDSVTSIEQYAFYGCSGLTSITIGNGVTSIGYSAFYNCNRLTNVTIPDSVTSIEQYAFYGCSGLTSITIGNGVTYIADDAFSRCSGLTSVTIPDSVTSIGENVFYGCSSLVSLTIPFVGSEANATSASADTLFGYIFGKYSYNGATATKQYYTSESYATYFIPSSLKEVTITGGKLLDGAFDNCSGLTSVTIGDGVTSIAGGAFSGCSSLVSMTISFVGGSADATSASAGTLFGYIFGSKSYNGATENMQVIGGKYITYYIPSSLKNVTVTGGKLLYMAFSGCSSLTCVTIGSGVTSIGDNVFSGCSGLTSVTIGDGVTSIGQYAFSGCNELSSVTIPDSVTSIESSAFSSCSSLTSITIPNSVTSIGSSAFSSCSSLTNVTIPDSVTSIGQYTFSECSNLVSITVPFVGGKANATSASADTLFGYIFGTGWYEGAKETTQYYNSKFSSATYYIPNSLKNVTVTGGKLLYGAFDNCSGLTSVTIGDGVTSIGQYAFSGCSGLTSVTIGNGVTSIGKGAFDGCSGLQDENGYVIANKVLYSYYGTATEALIPDSVTSIWNGVFYGCSGLTSVTIPNSVTSIGDSAFSGCNELTSVTIGDGVTSIGQYAFSGCNELTSVTIGSRVTSIGYSAFYNCSGLTNVTIPDSVTSIGDYAFDGCSGLTTLYVKATTPPTSRFSMLAKCSSLTTIYVPTSSVDAYKTKSGWSSYSSKIVGKSF